MLNYNSIYGMDNTYSYGMYPQNNGFNNYGNIGHTGYCPYAGCYNNGFNNYRGNCPYAANFYQYSPMVNSIVPSYGVDPNFNSQQAAPNYGELKMRTVSIEDIRD